MKHIRLAAGGGIIVLLVTAFLLRDAVYQAVIVPLAYVVWLARVFYTAVPQIALWGILLVAMFMIVLSNLIPEIRSKPKEQPKYRPAKGQVESLAGWMVKANKGTYFKWQIANRLGHIGLGLKETSERRGRPTLGNEAVEKYLEAGVNTSFVDYPNQKSVSTPLDVDPGDVVDYLETLMEISRGRHP